MLLLLTKYYR
ncbi:Protein of unknown function [Lactobacillus delbrueckii subsp. lactis]|nr:Putative uncharacterized protein [Lactobacillus delbrueckii subsp. lactis]CDR83299.1 Protein of unknown function [Lactobacillus delbrueckii subsp. lactis]